VQRTASWMGLVLYVPVAQGTRALEILHAHLVWWVNTSQLLAPRLAQIAMQARTAAQKVPAHAYNAFTANMAQPLQLPLKVYAQTVHLANTAQRAQQAAPSALQAHIVQKPRAHAYNALEGNMVQRPKRLR
jgi:hypothetical protein